jgi:beta-lactamase superfamily II metal-dependent hydrolase
VRLTLLVLSLTLLAPMTARAVTPNGRLQIVHMDVGQGDGTVIITPFGQVVMIDDGVYSNTAAPVNQLAALGVTHVDLHFASHYHADHIGAIGPIVASGVTIDAGWDRGESYTTQTYQTYVNTLGAKRHTLTKGQVFTLDVPSAHPVVIRVVDLRGAGTTVSDENAKCVVLEVSYGEFDEVFGGDLTGTAGNGGDIESIVGPEVGPVEVYKVHHHGSRYSSNHNFLNATRPKIGVIQCGNGNSYGHPTADALGRLHAHGVRTYWNETGAGVAPDPAWDRVANGAVTIQATWAPGGVDTVRGPGFADTLTNSGVAADLVAPAVSVVTPNGGEVWLEGDTRVVRWTATDDVGVESVDVDYSLDNAASWWPLAHGVTGVDSVAWTLPAELSDSARIRVTAFDHALNQAADASDAVFRIDAPVAGVPHLPLAVALALGPPRPNPSLGPVTLRFALPAPCDARLEVLDVGGRRVWSWEGSSLATGEHAVVWSGRTFAGARAGVGLYWVRLVAATGTRTMKLVRLE